MKQNPTESLSGEDELSAAEGLCLAADYMAGRAASPAAVLVFYKGNFPIYEGRVLMTRSLLHRVYLLELSHCV